MSARINYNNSDGDYPVRPNRGARRDRDPDYDYDGDRDRDREHQHRVDLHYQSQTQPQQSQVNYYESYRPGPGEAEDWTDDQEEIRRNYHNNNNNSNNLNRNNTNLHSGGIGVGSGSGRRSNLRNGHNGHSGGVSVPRTLANDEDMIESVSGASSVSASSGYPHNSRNHQFQQSQSSRSEKLVKMSRIPEKFHDEKDGSEIYVMDSAFPKRGGGLHPATAYSQYSGKSRAPSEMSSVKTKTSRKGGVVVDTMSAPNPFCPNTRGVCCLLVLVNLGLILVTLGFSIVLQLFDPPFVWYCGIAFLIVGFIALIVSLLFCVHLCRESRESRRQNGLQPGELYWTHHWQKRIALPGMGKTTEKEKGDDLSTVYSARTDEQDHKKYYDPRDQRHQSSRERDSMTPIHSYRH